MTENRRKRTLVVQHTYQGRIQRDLRLDNVRGILIILVVVGHFLLPLYQTRFITGCMYAIYSFHMPCFIMLSGFFSKGMIKGGKLRWDRVVQIFWLYVCYEVVVWITEGLLAGSLGWPDFFHESGAPWYLMSLGCYYLTLPLAARCRKRPYPLIFIAVTLLVSLFGKYYIHVEDLFSLDRTISFAPFFYLGYFCTQNDVDDYIESPLKRPVDIMAAFLLLVIFLGTYDFFGRYQLLVYGADYERYAPEMQSGLWALNIGWYFIALVLSLGLIGITLNRRMFIISNLGRNTLQIYFLHRPIRDLLQYAGLYSVVNPHSKLHVILLILFSILLAVVLGSELFTPAFDLLRTAFDNLFYRKKTR